MSLLLEIALIVMAVVVVAKMLNSRRNARLDREDLFDVTPREPSETDETPRLRDEVAQLKQRIQVLERIAVEKENSIAREIE